jgi:hypothetical protein
MEAVSLSSCSLSLRTLGATPADHARPACMFHLTLQLRRYAEITCFCVRLASPGSEPSSGLLLLCVLMPCRPQLADAAAAERPCAAPMA